jgi:hypothetical protein
MSGSARTIVIVGAGFCGTTLAVNLAATLAAWWPPVGAQLVLDLFEPSNPGFHSYKHLHSTGIADHVRLAFLRRPYFACLATNTARKKP